MDIDLRALQRLVASGDTDAMRRYAAKLLRSGQLDDVEIEARLGDQPALQIFLLAMDYAGEINLNSLWAYPYYADPYEEAQIGGIGEALFSFPVPYHLGMTLSDITYLINERLGREMPTDFIGAWVVEDTTVEMADKVSHDHLHYLMGTTEFLDLENEVVEQWTEALRYYVVRAESLLLITRFDETIFPRPGYDLGSYRLRNRRPFTRYIIEAERASRYSGEYINIPEPITRRISPKLYRQIPQAIGPQRYVVVLHTPSGKAFSLDRQYQLLEDSLPKEVIINALRRPTSIDSGKAVSADYQMPEWARELPEEEFSAFWVAE